MILCLFEGTEMSWESIIFPRSVFVYFRFSRVRNATVFSSTDTKNGDNERNWGGGQGRTSEDQPQNENETVEANCAYSNFKTE